MKFAPMIISYILFGLFALAFVTFGLSIAIINNPSQTIGNDTNLLNYKNSMEGNLANQYTAFNESEDSFTTSSTSLSNSPGGIIIDAISGIAKTIKNGATLITNLTLGFIKNKLFANSEFLLVFSIISGILILIALIAIVRLVSQGEGG